MDNVGIHEEEVIVVTSGNDVVTFLLVQHQQIKALFEAVIETSGDERERTFDQLRRFLAVHETAEELIVHPAARSALEDGSEIVAARLEEENDAKKILARIERLEVDSEEFAADILELQAAVLAHAEAEEIEEFEQLALELDGERLGRMRCAVELAEAIAPTRPHPGVESALANALVGPFASMLDRVRDVVTGRR